MTRADWALGIAIVALLGLILHAMIPTPPAHTADPLRLRG